MYRFAQVYGNTYDRSSLFCSLAYIRIVEVFQVLPVIGRHGRPSSLLGVIDVGVAADSFAVHSARILDVRHIKIATKVSGKM